MKKLALLSALLFSLFAGAQENNIHIQKFIDMNMMTMDELLELPQYHRKSEGFNQVVGDQRSASDDGGIRTFTEPLEDVKDLIMFLIGGGDNGNVLINESISGYNYNPEGLVGDNLKFITIIVTYDTFTKKDGSRVKYAYLTFIHSDVPVRELVYD
jgi:hypothetical protein